MQCNNLGPASHFNDKVRHGYRRCVIIGTAGKPVSSRVITASLFGDGTMKNKLLRLWTLMLDLVMLVLLLAAPVPAPA